MVKDKILILGIGLLIPLTTSALGYNLEEYYSLGLGNMWEYSIIDDDGSKKQKSEIMGKEMIDGKEAVKMLLTEDGDYAYLAFDSRGISMYKHFNKDDWGDGGEYIIYNPPIMIFPDIEIGQAKEYSTVWTKYNVTGEKKEQGTESVRIMLESVENVEVPAGKFSDCLKFSAINDKKKPNRSYEENDCDIWLAPGVGKVKEFCTSVEREAEGEAEETTFKIHKLISAVINGKRIGSQE